MEEIWKDVVGYEGLYQVSNLGRVRSLDRVIRTVNGKRFVKGVLLKLRKDKDGYMTAHLRYTANKKNRLAKVHRLVADAFISKVYGKNIIDHKNGLRDDNRAENLRWCTCKENNSFPLARSRNSAGVRKSYIVKSKLRKLRANTLSRFVKKRPVSIFKNGEHIGDFNTSKDAAIALGLNYVSVSACLNGRLRTIKGYTIRDLCTK